MWSTYLALACTVTILASQVVANPGDPAVTSNGVTYIGTRNAKGHSVFKSIPYAVPPVGRLRSQPPQRLTQPEGTVIDASNFAFACHKNSQASTGSSEDCLYLQLLAPPNVTETSNLPVIVYVLVGVCFTPSGWSRLAGIKNAVCLNREAVLLQALQEPMTVNTC